MPPRRKAVFLDRDGTLNREQGFVKSPAELEILPGVEAALEFLTKLGAPIIVLTNQSGIARGLYGEHDLARIHETLQDRLGGRIAAFFHCPHHPDFQDHHYGGECACRKPKGGLLAQAIEVLGLEPSGSFLIGDSARDLLMAESLPLATVLVKTGKPWEQELDALVSHGHRPHHVTDDLLAAARWIGAQWG